MSKYDFNLPMHENTSNFADIINQKTLIIMYKKIAVATFVCLLSITVGFAQKNFGEKISTKKAISYDELLMKMEKMDAKSAPIEVKVKGDVSAVCQQKGCWMKIVSKSDASKPQLFVKFKDYAYFMPKDLSGGQVVMKGKAYIEETSVDELKHYAEDDGKSPAEIAKITMPKKEYKFMADGVVIVSK
ncbi:MAG: DUF4920 domain-containing protein [Saprospiraceae bacterium]